MSDSSKDEASRKYTIAQEISEHIRELGEHEDTKAGRILEAMAFLSLTAVTAFGAFISMKLSVQITLFGAHFNLISISFAGFAVFVALGAFIFLETSLRGIETRHKKPLNESKIESKECKKRFEPQSLFYFKEISEESINQWISYFDSKAGDLLSKAYRDHIRETFVVSRKTRTKVKYCKLGKLCFYLAIIFFVILVIAGCYAL